MNAENALKSVFAAYGITSSELKVVKHLFEGLSNEQIGQRLSIKEKSVKYHLTSIYRKTMTGSRSEFLVRFMAPSFEAREKLIVQKYEAKLFAVTSTAKTRAEIISVWNSMGSTNYRTFNHQALKSFLETLDLVSNSDCQQMIRQSSSSSTQKSS